MLARLHLWRRRNAPLQACLACAKTQSGKKLQPPETVRHPSRLRNFFSRKVSTSEESGLPSKPCPGLHTTHKKQRACACTFAVFWNQPTEARTEGQGLSHFAFVSLSLPRPCGSLQSLAAPKHGVLICGACICPAMHGALARRREESAQSRPGHNCLAGHLFHLSAARPPDEKAGPPSPEGGLLTFNGLRRWLDLGAGQAGVRLVGWQEPAARLVTHRH